MSGDFGGSRSSAGRFGSSGRACRLLRLWIGKSLGVLSKSEVDVEVKHEMELCLFGGNTGP